MRDQEPEPPSWATPKSLTHKNYEITHIRCFKPLSCGLMCCYTTTEQSTEREWMGRHLWRKNYKKNQSTKCKHLSGMPGAPQSSMEKSNRERPDTTWEQRQGGAVRGNVPSGQCSLLQECWGRRGTVWRCRQSLHPSQQWQHTSPQDEPSQQITPNHIRHNFLP